MHHRPTPGPRNWVAVVHVQQVSPLRPSPPGRLQGNHGHDRRPSPVTANGNGHAMAVQRRAIMSMSEGGH